AGRQQAKNRVNAGHPRREHIGAVAAFKFGDSTLEGFAVGVIRARVVVTFVLAQLFVDVGDAWVDGRDNRAGGGIRLLTHVNRIGGKAHDVLLAVFPSLVKQAAWVSRPTASGRTPG